MRPPVTHRALSSLLLWAVTAALVFTLGFGRAGDLPAPTGEDAPYPTERLPADAFHLVAPPTGMAPAGLHGAKAPRLDATLAEIALTARRAETARRLAERLARQGALRLVDSQVQVELSVSPAAVESVQQAIAQMGGEISGRVQTATAHRLQAWLPVESLAATAALPGVHYIRRPASHTAFDATAAGSFAERQPGVVTEALPQMNVPAWQASGRTGRDVRVGIIDGGFAGYRALLSSELPAQVVTANFVDQESAEAVEGSTRHGAAVAEIVHDIAPEAQLYLARIDTDIDLHEAAAWLIDQKVDVIVTSIGWYNLAPGDGTGPFADLVKTAENAGALWVTAAGNDRERHWGGLYADPDNDRYHNFAATQEVNFFGPGDGSTYLVPPGLALNIHVRWDDWLDVRADYDLYLLRWSGSQWETVASSSNPQSGETGQTPTESIRFVTDGPPAAYGFILYQHSGSPTQPINFEVFTPRFLRPSLTVAARSLPNLADAPDALTVAAVNVFAPFAHQSYSSEGPTNGPGGAAGGGQPKPNLAAYTNVATASYGNPDSFGGTSAAAPHAAGAAALVKDAYPQAGPAEIRAFLQGRALDVGAAGQDAQTGAGRLWLGTPPANLAGSSMTVDAPRLNAGATVTYTIRLVNSGGITVTAQLLNFLPSALALLGPPLVDGAPYQTGATDVIIWRGDLPPETPVTIVYAATVAPSEVGGPVRLVNAATLSDDEGRVYRLSHLLNPLALFLPVLLGR